MDIITREQWNARKPRNASTNVRRRRVKLHWTATCLPAHASQQLEESHMRGLQNFHMDSRGWSDIAYNYVVFASGRIYEGRGVNVRSAANGGSVTNYQHQAIAFVANAGCPATQDAYQSAGALIHRYYSSDVKGHRDGSDTSCPGDAIYRWIQREGWNNNLTTKGPSYWTWRAWRCSEGPWAGLGKEEKGAKYRPRIPGKLDPRWPAWWLRFRRSGGCK